MNEQFMKCVKIKPRNEMLMEDLHSIFSYINEKNKLPINRWFLYRRIKYASIEKDYLINKIYEGWKYMLSLDMMYMHLNIFKSFEMKKKKIMISLNDKIKEYKDSLMLIGSVATFWNDDIKRNNGGNEEMGWITNLNKNVVNLIEYENCFIDGYRKWPRYKKFGGRHVNDTINVVEYVTGKKWENLFIDSYRKELKSNNSNKKWISFEWYFEKDYFDKKNKGSTQQEKPAHIDVKNIHSDDRLLSYNETDIDFTSDNFYGKHFSNRKFNMENIKKESRPRAKKIIEDLESKPGVYYWYKGKEIVYIGKSIDLKARTAEHLIHDEYGVSFDRILRKNLEKFNISVKYMEEKLIHEYEISEINRHDPVHNHSRTNTKMTRNFSTQEINVKEGIIKEVVDVKGKIFSISGRFQDDNSKTIPRAKIIEVCEELGGTYKQSAKISNLWIVGVGAGKKQEKIDFDDLQIDHPHKVRGFKKKLNEMF